MIRPFRPCKGGKGPGQTTKKSGSGAIGPGTVLRGRKKNLERLTEHKVTLPAEFRKGDQFFLDMPAAVAVRCEVFLIDGEAQIYLRESDVLRYIKAALRITEEE